MAKYKDFSPQQLDQRGILEVTDDSVNAAQNALSTGFDRVEVHAADGC